MYEKEKINMEFVSETFTKAINDAIGTMAGFEMKEIEKEIAERTSYKGEISGIMLLIGEKNAMLKLTMSRESAGILIAYMTGIMPDEISEDDVYDGVAELVNLVAGRSKALLSGTEYHFHLTPPFAIIGQDHFVIQKNKVSKCRMHYQANGLDLFVEVFYI